MSNFVAIPIIFLITFLFYLLVLSVILILFFGALKIFNAFDKEFMKQTIKCQLIIAIVMSIFRTIEFVHKYL